MARPLNPDNNYFENIDSGYKAYLLGFIYADGSIYDGRKEDRPNRQLRLSIYCASEDDYILDKFLKDNPSATKSYSIRKNRPKEKKITVVRVTNTKLCNDLINLGCLINKSKIGMKFPKLKTQYIRHFIRGFLDGDGSIIHRKVNYKYKRKTTYKLKKKPKSVKHKLRIAFSSTDKAFLEMLVSHLDVTSYYFSQKGKRTCYTLWIENRVSTNSVITYLYKNSVFYLKRKYQVYKEYSKAISSQAKSTLLEGSETT